MIDSDDKELYLTLTRCHQVIMRYCNNPKVLDELETWLDENIGVFDEQLLIDPDYILSKCISDLTEYQKERGWISGR